jgi:hypothetical protein
MQPGGRPFSLQPAQDCPWLATAIEYAVGVASQPFCVSIMFRRIATVLACCGFVMSVGLCGWTSRIFSHSPATPAVALRTSSGLAQGCALDDGVHFIVMQGGFGQSAGIQFDRATYLGNAGYHHGTVVSFLGFIAAVLPTTFNGGDYILSPHVAFVLPYWALLIGFGWLSLRLTGLSKLFAPYRKWTKASIALGLCVLILFALLNFVPSAWRPGATIEPEGFSQWSLLLFFPQEAYSEVMLEYGYPFVCLTRGIINGQPVHSFYGAEVGWKQHKAMENVCIAVIAMFATGIVVEWVRSRTRRREARDET